MDSAIYRAGETHRGRNMPSMKKLLLILTAILCTVIFIDTALAQENVLAATPPMGWNSWNKFGCNVTEDLVRQVADAMVSSGMKDAGFQYVIIDDCWQTGPRQGRQYYRGRSEVLFRDQSVSRLHSQHKG
jgi:hypothetical protein